MIRKCFAPALAVFALVVSGHLTNAQEVDIERVYGDGVHAYFNGKFKEAIKYLNKSIEAGSIDARAFYFRGLAQYQLGNKEAGNKDFIEGAALEQKFLNQQRVINRSLQRVQGNVRLSLEKVRRGNYETKTVKIDKTRIPVKSPFDINDSNSTAGDSKDNPKPNLPDSSKIDDPTAPFPGLKRKPSPKKGDKVAPKTEPPAGEKKDDGIFGDSKTDDAAKIGAKPADKPKMEKKVDDIFGDSKTEKKPTDAPKVEKKEEDIFGDSKPAEKKPTGTDKKSDPPKKSADKEDIFGESKSADAKKKAPSKDAPKKKEVPKKKEADDLFGDG